MKKFFILFCILCVLVASVRADQCKLPNRMDEFNNLTKLLKDSVREADFVDACRKLGGNVDGKNCICVSSRRPILFERNLDIVQAKSCAHLSGILTKFPELSELEAAAYLKDLGSLLSAISENVVAYYKHPFKDQLKEPDFLKDLAKHFNFELDFVSGVWQQATEASVVKSLLYEIESKELKASQVEQIQQLVGSYAKILGSEKTKVIIGSFLKEKNEHEILNLAYLQQYLSEAGGEDPTDHRSYLLKKYKLAHQELDQFQKLKLITYDYEELQNKIKETRELARETQKKDAQSQARPNWFHELKGSLNKVTEATLNITVANILYYGGGARAAAWESLSGKGTLKSGFRNGSALGTNFMLEQQRLNNLTLGSALGTTEELSRKTKFEGFLALNPMTHTGAAFGNAMEGLYEGYATYASRTLGVTRKEYEKMKESDPLLKAGEVSFLIAESAAGLALSLATANPTAYLARVARAEQAATIASNAGRLKRLKKIEKGFQLKLGAKAGRVLAVSGGMGVTISVAQEVYQSDKEKRSYNFKNVVDNSIKSTATSTLFMGSLARLGHASVLKNPGNAASVGKKMVATDMLEGSGEFEESIRRIRESENLKQSWAAGVLGALSLYDFGGDLIMAGLSKIQLPKKHLAKERAKTVDSEAAQATIESRPIGLDMSPELAEDVKQIKLEYLALFNDDKFVDQITKWRFLKEKVKEAKTKQEKLNLSHEVAQAWVPIRKANDDFLTKLSVVLEAHGIPTKIDTSYGGFGQLVFDFDDPNQLRTLSRYKNRLGFNKMTISLVENIEKHAHGFYSRSSQRVEIGTSSIMAYLAESFDNTILHELRHAMFEAMRMRGSSSVFHVEFTDPAEKLSVDGYEGFLSAEELYTFSNSLEQIGKIFSPEAMRDQNVGQSFLRSAEQRLEILDSVTKTVEQMSSNMRGTLIRMMGDPGIKIRPFKNYLRVSIKDVQERTATFDFVTATEKALGRDYQFSLSEFDDRRSEYISLELSLRGQGLTGADLDRLRQELQVSYLRTTEGESLSQKVSDLRGQVAHVIIDRMTILEGLGREQRKEVLDLKAKVATLIGRSDLTEEQLLPLRDGFLKLGRNVKEGYKGYLLGPEKVPVEDLRSLEASEIWAIHAKERLDLQFEKVDLFWDKKASKDQETLAAMVVDAEKAFIESNDNYINRFAHLCMKYNIPHRKSLTANGHHVIVLDLRQRPETDGGQQRIFWEGLSRRYGTEQIMVNLSTRAGKKQLAPMIPAAHSAQPARSK